MKSAKIITMIIAAIVLLLVAATIVRADCTNDGEYSALSCYGIEHGLIQFGVMTGVEVLEHFTGAPDWSSTAAGAVSCGVFIAREINNEDGPFESTDAILDWAVPCGMELLYDPKTVTRFFYAPVDEGAVVGITTHF